MAVIETREAFRTRAAEKTHSLFCYFLSLSVYGRYIIQPANLHKPLKRSFLLGFVYGTNKYAR